MKKPEFIRDPFSLQYGSHVPLKRAVMSAEPSILSRKLKPEDLFVIFASDGLWEQLSDEAAVEIVLKNPRVVSLRNSYWCLFNSFSSIMMFGIQMGVHTSCLLIHLLLHILDFHCYQKIALIVMLLSSILFQGIAKRLVRAAIEEAARKREMRYDDIRRIEKGIRRHFHDDITVIVIYLDQQQVSPNGKPTDHSIVDCTNTPVDIYSFNSDEGENTTYISP